MTLFSEVLKLKDGVLFNLDGHQERVNRTLCRCYGTEIDLSVLREKIPGELKPGLFKCRVLYSGRIESIEFTPYRCRHPASVGVLTDNEIDYAYKYADRSRLNGLLRKSGCDDLIIIKNGFVTDAFSSSLVFESAGRMYTPKDFLLPGTKRKLLLDRKEIEEVCIPVKEIRSFEAVYLINAMVDLEDRIKVDTASLVYL